MTCQSAEPRAGRAHGTVGQLRPGRLSLKEILRHFLDFRFATANPGGVRCTYQDAAINVFTSLGLFIDEAVSRQAAFDAVQGRAAGRPRPAHARITSHDGDAVDAGGSAASNLARRPASCINPHRSD